MTNLTFSKILRGAQFAGALAIQLLLAYMTVRCAASVTTGIFVQLTLMLACAVAWKFMLIPSARELRQTVDSARRSKEIRISVKEGGSEI